MTSNLPAKPHAQLPGDSLPPGGPQPHAWDAAGLALPEEGISWRRLLVSAWRYKWLVVLVTVLGTAAGVAGTRFIKPEYEAQSTIWIEVPRREQNRQGPIQQSELLRSSAWIDLLKSYVVLDPVVRDLRLYLGLSSPADSVVFSNFELGSRFVPGEYRLVMPALGRVELQGRGGQVLETAAPGEPIGSSVGFPWTPDPDLLFRGEEIRFSVDNPRDVATRLRDDINTRMNVDGNFLRLALRGSRAERVATILNTVAERYVEVAAELKGAKLEELTKILDEQVHTAWLNLEAAESELERFRVQTITLPSEPSTPVVPGLDVTRNPAFENYFTLNVEREQLRRDRQALERVLDEAADSDLSVVSLEVIDVVRGDSELMAALTELTQKRAELRVLRGRYSDEYPTVRELAADIGALEMSIVILVESLQDEVVTRESELDDLITSASGELSQIPPRSIEEERLERQKESRETLYTDLRTRYEEARLAAASSIPDVRVLDVAVAPHRPTNERAKPLLILLAFTVSLVGAVFGANLLDRVDPRLKYPDQISRELGLAVLGTVPHVSARGHELGVQNTSEVVEAFRVVRLNLAHAYGTGPVIVAVTSPSPEDGKSFVTANLGLAFADLGRRTLVIDADVRRGRLHRLLGGDRKPGLTDYLAGRAALEQIVQPTKHGPLHRIACGTRRQDAPELMQSNAMSVLLAQLRPNYDVILLDCAPLAAGVDPLALGTLTGNMVIVLRTGATDRELTEAKLDMLDPLPIRLLGAVLNDVPPKGVYHYYRYASGYETWDEETVETDYRPIKNVYMPNGQTSEREDGSGPVRDSEPPQVKVEPELHEGPRHGDGGKTRAQSDGATITGQAVDADPTGKEDVWFHPGLGLWYHPDWDVAASEPATAEEVAVDEREVAVLSVEELAPDDVAGRDGNGNGAEAPMQKGSGVEAAGGNGQHGPQAGGNGGPTSASGNGDVRGNLEDYMESHLENFRQHQRRNRQRYWK